MAAGNRRTRAQIRQSVGLNTNKIFQDAGSVTSSPSEESTGAGELIDQNLAFGTENQHRGKWLLLNDSASVQTQRRVLKSSPSERSLTPSVAFSGTPDTAWVYEMWEQDLSPIQVNDFIDQAIMEADRKGSVPLTSDSFHTGGEVNAWGLSSSFMGARYVEKRTRYVGEQLVSFDTALSSATNSTVVTDSEDVKEGSAINAITIAAGASSAETVATSSFAAVNMRGYTHIEVWAKTNVTTTSSNLNILLQETSSVLETIAMPALNADSWTRVSLALGNPELDSAVSRFVLQTGSSDGGSVTILMDDLITYRQNAEEWETIHRDKWEIDKDRRELELKPGHNVGYSKLRVTGVQKPALMTTDSQLSDIDPTYVINSATAKAYAKLGDDEKSLRYERFAQQQRVRMNTPSNIKWADD